MFKLLILFGPEKTGDTIEEFSCPLCIGLKE